eukprot:438246-Prorocentrum_minimum.AAC.1
MDGDAMHLGAERLPVGGAVGRVVGEEVSAKLRVQHIDYLRNAYLRHPRHRRVKGAPEVIQNLPRSRYERR